MKDRPPENPRTKTDSGLVFAEKVVIKKDLFISNNGMIFSHQIEQMVHK